MIIKKVPTQEIISDYAEFYYEIFDETDVFQSPAFVYIGHENDKLVGFMSGYNHNLSTVYLQYVGAVKGFRGYRAFRFFKEAIEFIHKEYHYIMLWIKNNNTVALKIALSGDFKIIGIRLATDKSLYVELLKERQNG